MRYFLTKQLKSDGPVQYLQLHSNGQNFWTSDWTLAKTFEYKTVCDLYEQLNGSMLFFGVAESKTRKILKQKYCPVDYQSRYCE